MVRFDNILKRLFAFVTGIKFRTKNKFIYWFVYKSAMYASKNDYFFPPQILPDIDINLFFIDETTSYMKVPNNTTSKKFLIPYSFLMTVILYRARL